MTAPWRLAGFQPLRHGDLVVLLCSLPDDDFDVGIFPFELAELPVEHAALGAPGKHQGDGHRFPSHAQQGEQAQHPSCHYDGPKRHCAAAPGKLVKNLSQRCRPKEGAVDPAA